MALDLPATEARAILSPITDSEEPTVADCAAVLVALTHYITERIYVDERAIFEVKALRDEVELLRSQYTKLAREVS